MAAFSENLQFYRKKADMTQEELAERMKVSRQTISKWESGATYPEMEKILQLCEMFRCDMDTLIRGDATESFAEDNAQYDQHKNEFSKAVAFGVGFILFGVTIYEFLMGIRVSESYANMLFLIMCVVSVLLFVVHGLKDEEFRRRYPVIENVYTTEEIDKFHKKYINVVAVAIGLILCGVIYEGFVEEMQLPARFEEDIFHCVFMIPVTIAVTMLVYIGCQKEKYDIEKYNKKNRKEGLAKKRGALIGKICAVIMLIAVIVFFLLGFVGNYWNISWIAFPVGGILCGIVSIILAKE